MFIFLNTFNFYNNYYKQRKPTKYYEIINLILKIVFFFGEEGIFFKVIFVVFF